MNKLIAAIATAGSLLAFQASAASVNITGITGTWTTTTGTTATGLGTSSIRWGNPVNSGQFSGYDYVSATTPISNIAEDTAFDLGIFRHLNNPIFPPSITGAVLQLVIDLDIASSLQTITQTYAFTHEETPNGDNPCAYGGANAQGVNINGCADRVTAAINLATSDTFFIGLDEYVFTIDGFKVGNSLFTEFLTVEQQTNEASLQGSYTLKSNVAPVPLPAAGWLLVAGIAGLGAAARRRKAA